MKVKLCNGQEVEAKDYLQQFLNSGADTVLHPREDYNKRDLFAFATERSVQITNLHRVLTGFLLAVAEAVEKADKQRSKG